MPPAGGVLILQGSSRASSSEDNRKQVEPDADRLAIDGQLLASGPKTPSEHHRLTSSESPLLPRPSPTPNRLRTRSNCSSVPAPRCAFDPALLRPTGLCVSLRSRHGLIISEHDATIDTCDWQVGGAKRCIAAMGSVAVHQTIASQGR